MPVRLASFQLCISSMKLQRLIRNTVGAVSALPALVTALSLVRHPHWLFRMWDFPRVQIATIATLAPAAYLRFFYRRKTSEKVMLSLTAAALLWQVFKIRPYTLLARRRVRRATAAEAEEGKSRRISLLISNVLMENDEHERVVEAVDRHRPDVVLAVEVDERWLQSLTPLLERYPHRLLHPQSNYYGMVLLSKLELIAPRVEFLIQDDVPSIHTAIRLRSGDVVDLHALHPRPPEPLRDQRSTPRDAELVVVGRQIRERSGRPTIVAGDLNDVAWSETSELFLRLSGLLDPRMGRGMFNSYNANNPLFRFPLDHVFHSEHFKLVSLKRLDSVGSDHFPLLIDLLYDPDAGQQQEKTPKAAGDETKAAKKIEKEREDAATGADRPKE